MYLINRTHFPLKNANDDEQDLMSFVLRLKRMEIDVEELNQKPDESKVTLCIE